MWLHNPQALKTTPLYSVSVLITWKLLIWHVVIFFFFFVSFHFLHLLHKMLAISQRQGVQLSRSIPSILRFHSRTLLNPDRATEEKKYSHSSASFSLVLTSLRITSIHGDRRSWPWLCFTVSQSPLASFPHVGPTAAQDCWSHRNMASRTDHWMSFELPLRGSKTADNETVGPSAPGQL